MVDSPRQDEVWLVSVDPTDGAEVRKTRPCLIVSPDEANEYLRTVIVAPMNTTKLPYPTRVSILFQGKRGQVALDQIRAADRQRSGVQARYRPGKGGESGAERSTW